jgi:hypothetical protein
MKEELEALLTKIETFIRDNNLDVEVDYQYFRIAIQRAAKVTIQTAYEKARGISRQ